MPYFSVRDRAGADMSEAYLKSVSFITALAWPFFVFLGLMAYPVIRILFGTQWDASVPLVPYLCAAGMLGGPFLLGGSVLIAIGQIKEVMRPLIGIAVMQVSAVLIASMWGIETVAAAYVGVAVVGMAWWYKTLQRVLGFTVRDFARSLRKSAAVTLCAVLLPIVVVMVSPPGPNNLWLPLVLAGFGAFIGWIGGIFGLHHPFREEILRAFRHARNRR